MGFWERFFKRRTQDQTSADHQVCHSRTRNVERQDDDLNPHAMQKEHVAYGESIPSFMRKSRTKPARHDKSGRDTEDVQDAGANDVLTSCSPNRQVKGALSFVLPDDRQAELMALCAQLDTHRSEVIRACLEMGMPLFKSHPDLYEYFRQRSRQGW